MHGRHLLAGLHIDDNQGSRPLELEFHLSKMLLQWMLMTKSSICHQPLQVSSLVDAIDLDIPFEPADWEPIDWEAFGAMKQDIASYFIKTDEFGKSEMDYFVETKMDFGKDVELPIAPAQVKPAKTVRSVKSTSWSMKQWVPTKPIARAPSKPAINAPMSRRMSVAPSKPKMEKFIREDMRDELAALEAEELALCKQDDFGLSFDLEL